MGGLHSLSVVIVRSIFTHIWSSTNMNRISDTFPSLIENSQLPLEKEIADLIWFLLIFGGISEKNSLTFQLETSLYMASISFVDGYDCGK